MSTANSLQSLDLVAEEVIVQITKIATALEHYANQLTDVDYLELALGHTQKLKGIYSLLAMSGAQQLTRALADCLDLIGTKELTAKSKLIEATFLSLVQLERYTIHVRYKTYDFPQIVIPAINELRTAMHQPKLAESTFFFHSGLKPRSRSNVVNIITERSAEKSRHIRQIYQMGLIEVLTQSNLAGGLKMMRKALVKLDSDFPRLHSPNLWWIGQGLLDAFLSKNLKLSRPRLVLFSQIDQQIKQIENKPGFRIKDNKTKIKSLTKEMLYLTAISTTRSKCVNQIVAHFNLSEPLLTDKQLNQEINHLQGPTLEDYQALSKTLKKEIMLIEDSLHQASQVDFCSFDLRKILQQMSTLNKFLKAIRLDEPTIKIGVSVSMLKRKILKNKLLSEKESAMLFLVLEHVKSQCNRFELRNKSDNRLYERKGLEGNLLLRCLSTHKKIKKLIGILTEFSARNRKVLLIKETPELLKAIKNGFEELNATEALPIIDNCISFLVFQLINQPKKTSEEKINLFADVIGSLEFYLDTLKFNVAPSRSILRFAQESLSKL